MATDSNSKDLHKVRRVAEASRRRLMLFHQRPESPRGVSWNAQGYVAWDEPQELRNVTHYNVYAGDDATLYRRYPVGTKLMNDLMPNTTLIWVAAYNEESGLESPKIQATEVGTSTGSTGIPGAEPDVTAPAAAAPNVTGLTATNERINADQGGEMVRIKGTFALPADVSNYTGARVIAQVSGDAAWTLIGDLDATATAYASQWMPAPGASKTWTVKVQSYNLDLVLNALDGSTPTATTTIAAGVGGYDMAKVLAGTYDSVAFDLVGGKFVVKSVDMTKVWNFNASQFDVGVGGFHIKALAADLINTGTLKVGGTSGQPGNVFVVGSDNSTMIGWVGAYSGYYGGWFKNLYLGGTSPADALVNVINGAVSIRGTSLNIGPGTNGGNGQVWLYNNTSIYGWMGTSGGYNGAWFSNLWIGGSGPGDAKIAASGGSVTMTGIPQSLTSGNFQVDLNTLSGLYGSGTAGLVVRSWNVGGTSYAHPENGTEIRDTGLYIEGRVNGMVGYGPYPAVSVYNNGAQSYVELWTTNPTNFPQKTVSLECSTFGGYLRLYGGGTQKILLNGFNGNMQFAGALCTANYSSAAGMTFSPTYKIPVYDSDGGSLLGYIPII